MGDLMNFIIPIAVGSIIGYITNWLAIKMLFRPLHEKRIFGYKLPLTPGLIPKEKGRIAKSVGQAVGESILSPDVVTKAIQDNMSNEKLKAYLRGKLEGLRESEKSLNDMLRDEDKLKLYNIIVSSSQNITDQILDYIYSANIKETLIQYILKSGESIVESPKTREYLTKLISNTIEEVKEDKRQIREVISEEDLKNIDSILENNKSNIGQGVRAVYNNPDVRIKLYKNVSKIVEGNLNKVLAVFVTPDQIAEIILQLIEKYINDPKSNDDYITIIRGLTDKVLDRKSSDLIGYFDGVINDENINKLSSRIIDKIDIARIEDDLEAFVDTFISSDRLRAEVESIVKNVFMNIVNKPISQFPKNVDEGIVKESASLFKSVVEEHINKELPRIVEILDISKIVENQINSFDVEYTEKLILDIADKELKAITWLGALLGAIMGILTPLLQMINLG